MRVVRDHGFVLQVKNLCHRIVRCRADHVLRRVPSCVVHLSVVMQRGLRVLLVADVEDVHVEAVVQDQGQLVWVDAVEEDLEDGALLLVDDLRCFQVSQVEEADLAILAARHKLIVLVSERD